jgi:hypothetical protein
MVADWGLDDKSRLRRFVVEVGVVLDAASSRCSPERFLGLFGFLGALRVVRVVVVVVRS